MQKRTGTLKNTVRPVWLRSEMFRRRKKKCPEECNNIFQLCPGYGWLRIQNLQLPACRVNITLWNSEEWMHTQNFPNFYSNMSSTDLSKSHFFSLEAFFIFCEYINDRPKRTSSGIGTKHTKSQHGHVAQQLKVRDSKRFSSGNYRMRTGSEFVRYRLINLWIGM